MKIELLGQQLSISEIPELTAVNAVGFRDEIHRKMPALLSRIDIDLSATRFVDSIGLGALFALHRATAGRKGMTLRLLNPRPEIRQLLELTQMEQLFDIV